MSISRVEIKDFLVFKGDFAVDFCPGVNVFIGGNGTGKTTLLKYLYWWSGNYKYSEEDNPERSFRFTGIEHYFGRDQTFMRLHSIPRVSADKIEYASVFIPEKDVLEHAKGLLTFIEDKQTGFSAIYKSVLVKAQDVPTQKQTPTQQRIGQKIVDIIGGKVAWDKGDGSFYTIRADGIRIPFANEASGYKKFGYLGLLVACGQLEPGTILFWDEPENSLNPELIPVLVEILLELERGGVQIFLATHSYILARWFDVKRDREKGDEVMFYNMSKPENGDIECVSAEEYTKLPESILDAADEKLFKAVVANAMGVSENE
jgi:predicted ATPase